MGVIILLPVYLGGRGYKRGELIRGFTVYSNLSRELFRIQSELKASKQEGDLRALLTARKGKENKGILTMLINAKSQ